MANHLPNFRSHDPSGDFPDYPFEREPIKLRMTSGRLLTAYAATSVDGRFVVMPLLATAPVPLTARMPTGLTMFDPMSGAVLDARDLAAGETFTLPPRDATRAGRATTFRLTRPRDGRLCRPCAPSSPAYRFSSWS